MYPSAASVGEPPALRSGKSSSLQHLNLIARSASSALSMQCPDRIRNRTDAAPETLLPVESQDEVGMSRANAKVITNRVAPPEAAASREHRTRHAVQNRNPLSRDKRPVGLGWCEKNDSVCCISDTSEVPTGAVAQRPFSPAGHKSGIKRL